MLLERAELQIREGMERDFSTAMTEFRSLLKPFSTGGAMEHFKMS